MCLGENNIYTCRWIITLFLKPIFFWVRQSLFKGINYLNNFYADFFRNQGYLLLAKRALKSHIEKSNFSKNSNFLKKKQFQSKKTILPQKLRTKKLPKQILLE